MRRAVIRSGSMQDLGKTVPSGARTSGHPTQRPTGLTCRELVALASLDHYTLLLDRRCRLFFARRTGVAFERVSDIRECFRRIELELASVPRHCYHLLVDTRYGPSRNDRGFELVLEQERGKLLLGFAKNAALAATAAGRLQIQRFAKRDGRKVLTTDDPAQAFAYLGLRPHII